MSSKSRNVVISITESGRKTARILQKELPEIDHLSNSEKGGLAELTREAFHNYDGLIFIMAAGIVVRMIAPFLRDKYRDPAVVVVDDARRFAVSLLSGHEGGANRLAWDAAAVLGSIPVITTATDTNRRTTVGIGCRRGVTSEEVRKAVREALTEAGISVDEVRTAATIDLKRNEQGLVEGIRSLGIPLLFFSTDAVNRYDGEFDSSSAAVRRLEVRAVAEPCALLAAGIAGIPSGTGRDGRKAVRLILPKTVSADRKITIAAARESSGEEVI